MTVFPPVTDRRRRPVKAAAVFFLLVLAGWVFGWAGAVYGAEGNDDTADEAEPEPMATVRLLPRATVEGRRIYLGDIAELEGDPELVAALEALDVGRAPVSGQTIYLNEPRIRVAMRRARFPERQVRFAGETGNVAITLAASSPPAQTERTSAPQRESPGEGEERRRSDGQASRPDGAKGKRVTLLVRHGVVEVMTTARLMEDAWIGDLVQVEVDGSGQMLWGVLATEDRVEADLSPAPRREEP